MKRVSSLLGLLLIGICFAFGQTMHRMTDLSVFKRRLAETAQRVHSIECDFKQTKYMTVFRQKIVSRGRFYYQKPDKICMDYARPVNYAIVINGHYIKTVSGGKKSVTNIGANKMMNQMQDMIAASMTGDLSRLSSQYRTAFYENDKYYLARVIPVDATIRQYMQQIDIYLDKASMSVYELRLRENASNYTEYLFYNRRFNSLRDESVFSVR